MIICTVFLEKEKIDKILPDNKIGGFELIICILFNKIIPNKILRSLHDNDIKNNIAKFK